MVSSGLLCGGLAMAVRRAGALTEAELSETVLAILRRAGCPALEGRIRDEACDIHPRQIDLLMIRAALQRLKEAHQVVELGRALWSLAEPQTRSIVPTAQGTAWATTPILTPIVAEGPPFRVGPPRGPASPSTTSVAVSPPGAGSRRPDDAQQEVIDAKLGDRLLVEAGPGYGKTDVICARVAALLGSQVEGSELLLLSFTRTAVREMRNRIRSLAGQGVDTRAVEIRTVDSWVADLRRGFVRGARSGSFDDSILDVVRLLSGPQTPALLALVEELARYRHVFVDEAQDLVGARAQLIIRVLKRLKPEAGWTIFADRAQALYDWAEEGMAAPAASFLEVLKESRLKYSARELKTLHRTSNPELKKLLLASREIVLNDRESNRAGKLRKLLLDGKPSFEPKQLAAFVRALAASGEECLFLFRTRVEALEASSYLNKEAVPHRLRFGGLPQTVAPWVAVALATIARPDFTRTEFDRALPAFEDMPSFSGWDPDNAWRALRRIGHDGSNRVSCSAVAASITAGRRLEELTIREVGRCGPILSTIHGSKGREAHSVFACLSEIGIETEDPASEGRVLYVAASRARGTLEFRRAGPWRWRYESGRAWGWLPRGKGLQVEFGKNGDVDVLRSVLLPGQDAKAMQQRLAQTSGHVVSCKTHVAKVGSAWLWPIKHADEAVVGALSDGAVRELRQIAHSPMSAPHLYQMEVTSAAVRPEDMGTGDVLPEPWKTTGVWLAPVVTGLSYVSKGKK